MGEVYLSKENIGRLTDLGFENVAAVVLLPCVRLGAVTTAPYDDMSISDQTTAVKNLSQILGKEARLDVLLQVFAGLVLRPATAECRPEAADNEAHDINNTPLETGQSGCLHSAINKPDLLLYDDFAQTLAAQVLRNRGATLDKHYAALQAEAAIASLVVLLHRLKNLRLPTSTLVAVTAYTDPNDSWATETAACLAQRILHSQLSGQGLANFIMEPVLNQHVRLILSSSTGGEPAAQSRAFGSVPASNLAEYENAAAVLNWAIEMTEGAEIGKHWHRFVPALVTLAECHETSIKERGLKAIISFLAKCPSSAIYTTGMDQLFERTILPALLLLPTVTPEKDSAILLKLGYVAALKLATIGGDTHTVNRRRILDAIVRDGIIAGFLQAADYVFVVDILMQYSAKVVLCLGIFSIKHLQDLLDVIESVMCDPFGAGHPGVLIAAVDALMAIITNCWPRISNTKRVEQILRILSVCWLNMNNDAFHPDHERGILDLKCRILQAAGSVRSLAQTNASEMNRTSSAAVSRDNRLQDILMQ